MPGSVTCGRKRTTHGFCFSLILFCEALISLPVLRKLQCAEQLDPAAPLTGLEHFLLVARRVLSVAFRASRRGTASQVCGETCGWLRHFLTRRVRSVVTTSVLGSRSGFGPVAGSPIVFRFLIDLNNLKMRMAGFLVLCCMQLDALKFTCWRLMV